LHGAGDTAINSVIKAAGILVKYKYCTITRMKTKTLHSRDDTKVGKLIIQLTKGPDFEDVYKEFEEIRKERNEAFQKKKENSKDGEEDSEEEKEPTKVTTPEKAEVKSNSSATEVSPTNLAKQD
jgi:Ran GTPase-activating protein (RanGAP) involved in mRNA processing and transport